jgi:hypothetical protein
VANVPDVANRRNANGTLLSLCKPALNVFIIFGFLIIFRFSARNMSPAQNMTISRLDLINSNLLSSVIFLAARDRLLYLCIPLWCIPLGMARPIQERRYRHMAVPLLQVLHIHR